MLHRLRLSLTPPDGEMPGVPLSSLLHGALLERVTPAYGAFLHRAELKPFSQFVYNAGDMLHWEIQALNDEAAEQLLQPLNDAATQSVYLKHKQLSLPIAHKELTQSSFEELVHRVYVAEERLRVLRIRFCSPCAFKSGGEYIFFPDIRLIFQSLIRKYDAFSPEFTVGGAETLQGLLSQSTLLSYRLRSAYFPLEGVRIPAFVGNLSIRLRGAETAARLATLLAAFGEYSGVGIKTSLGMGAVRLQEDKG